MFRISLALLCMTACIVVASVSLAAPQNDERAADPYDVNPRWLLPLDRDDRTFLDDNVGCAPPAFTDELTWVGEVPMAWEKLRGSVVVLQTWNTRHAAARTWPARAARATEDWRDRDVVVIAVHTPESADTAETFLERRPQKVPVAIDPVGTFCDALGAYKTPVNVVVDRAGTVRYAGLDEGGINAAVALLVDEDASELPEPKPRPTEEKKAEPPAEFPTFNNNVGSANDVRGKTAPKLYVQQWITKEPSVEGKVVIVDFWATWCKPCVDAIPHMSEIAEAFPDDVVVIGISSENRDDLIAGVKTRNLRSKINYTIAVDPSRRMSGTIGVKGIPHVIVLSSDRVVRWQGHPMSGLTKDVVRQIVEANGGNKPDPRLRWTEKGLDQVPNIKPSPTTDPPTFEFTYSVTAPEGAVGGKETPYVVTGVVENTSRTLIKKLELNVLLNQQNSPNKESKSIDILSLRPGEKRPYEVRFRWFNYRYIGDTSVPTAQVTGRVVDP